MLPASALVVDDDQLSCRLLTAQLRTLGDWSADCCSGSAEALSKLDERFYPLVFLDLKMAGMDGLALALEIRRREQVQLERRQAVIICITSSNLCLDGQRWHGAGVDHCLT